MPQSRNSEPRRFWRKSKHSLRWDDPETEDWKSKVRIKTENKIKQNVKPVAQENR